MKLSKYLILGGFLLSFQVSADSVYEWGHWQAEEDPAKAILEGADPSEVTAPTAAGGISRPFSPVVFPRNEPPLDTGFAGPSSAPGRPTFIDRGNAGGLTRNPRGPARNPRGPASIPGAN